MRTLVDIPDDDLALLNGVVEKLTISRAEFIRRAVSASLAPYREIMNHESFGLWAIHPSDGLQYERRMREEW